MELIDYLKFETGQEKADIDSFKVGNCYDLIQAFAEHYHSKQLRLHVVVGSENCNKCKKEISIEEFDYGMGECLVCFPKF